MDQGQTLFQAVLASPEDDAPRLVYADWLDETGDPDRAALIRAQCQAAALPAWHPVRRAAFDAAGALLARNAGRWRDTLPRIANVRWLEWERGFPSGVSVPTLETLYACDRQLAEAAPLHRVELNDLDESRTPRPRGACPWLRTLRLRSSYGRVQSKSRDSLLSGVTAIEGAGMSEGGGLAYLDRLGDARPFTRLSLGGTHTAAMSVANGLGGWADELTRLDLGTRFRDYNTGYFEDPLMGRAGARKLALSKHLRNLTALGVGGQGIGHEGFAELVGSPHLANVRELSLRQNGIGPISALADSEGAPLVALDLSLNPIGDAGAATIAASARCAALESLCLDTCEVGAAGVRELTGSPLWHTLRVLDLSRNPLGADGVRALAEAEVPERLHTLRLADADFMGSGAELLSEISWLSQLVELDLSRYMIVDPSLLAALAGGPLRHLRLADNTVGPKQLLALAPLWATLVSLDLSRNALCGADWSKLGVAPNLQTLRLRECGIAPEAFAPLSAALADSPLRTLEIAENPVGDAGFAALLEAPFALGLDELDASQCELGPPSADALLAGPGLAHLSRTVLYNNAFGYERMGQLSRDPARTGALDLYPPYDPEAEYAEDDDFEAEEPDEA